MRAVVCSKFGLPEDLEVKEVDEPVTGKNQVKLKVEACGVNFPDTLIINNKYQFKPELPFWPGGEVAGIVEEVGEGVTDFSEGDKVMTTTIFGGFAEKLVVGTDMLMRRPEKMSGIVASGIQITYGTSMHALKQRADLKPGETLLVLGAAGGVGMSAVEIGKAMGATVIGAASSDEKLEVVKKAGADHLINYSSGDLREQLKEITGSKEAVDVLYDPVGADLFEPALRSMKWKGRALVIGFAGGDDKIPKIPMNLPLLKGCSIVGVFWGSFRVRESKVEFDNFNQLFEWFNSGKIDPLVSDVYPLEEAPIALRKLMNRQAIGKIVLTTE